MKALLAVALLVLVTLAGATTYYVAKTGDDDDNGSEGAPWLTVSYAATQLMAGDTCWVKAGLYTEPDTLWFDTNAGTESDTIVYKSYDGWNTTIDGGIWVMKQYISIEDFRLTYSRILNSQVLRFFASHCALRGCEVVMSPAHSSNVSGVSNTRQSGNDTLHGLLYDNNTIHGFGYDNNAHAIYVKGHHQTVTNNICYDNRGRDIPLYDEGDSVNYCEVAYNICHNSITGNGILVSGNNNWIHHNVVYGNTQDCGIKLYWSTCTYDNEVSNNVLFNNVYGIMVYPVAENLIRNNLLINNGFTDDGTFNVRQLFVDDSTSDVILDYNCYYPDGSAAFRWGINGERDFAGHQVFGQDANGMSADPLCVDTASYNFHLTATSPCIDAGDPTTLPGFDIEGVTTPQGAEIDIGAYEYEDGRGPAKRHWKHPKKNKVVGP